MPRQLRLALSNPDLRRESYVASSAAEPALALLDAPAAWPGGALALTGPEGVGKTHLAHDWALQQSALLFDPARTLAAQIGAAAGRAVVWDDADQGGADEALFHLINAAASGAGPLLLTGRTPPREWPAGLPDLRSRLNAVTVAELPEPDDDALGRLLMKLFRERHIRPAPDVLSYLLRRIPRSATAARRAVERLDETADAERREITRVLAARVLEPELPFGGEE